MTFPKVFATAALIPLSALAQTMPGAIDEALVGDWQCGEVRIYITQLGSIELLGGGCRAGLYDATAGSMKIRWDEGGETTWAYSMDQDGITMIAPDDEEYSCVPRK